MCTYIAAVLPAGTDAKATGELFKKHDLGFYPIHDRPPAISKDQLYVLTFTQNCDCGTVLGRGYIRNPHPKEPESEIPKLRKKGWSDAKINRWLEDKTRKADPHDTRSEEELARWMATIQDIVTSGITTSLGLFVHFYNEGYDADIIKRVERVKLMDLSPELLLGLADDTLYEFIAPVPAGRR